jgi:hypothetical protein
MYDYQYPIARRLMEDRLKFLEKEFNKFDYMINPYHVQPGLFLEVDITSIKRKKATLNAMANVLNEFLHGVSKGFQDAAFASFSRRRSTVREDINQSFADASTEAPAAAPGQSYLDMLNTGESVAAAAAPPALEAPKKRGRKAAASKAAGSKPAGAKPAKRGRGAGRGRGRGSLREVELTGLKY